MLTCNTEGVYNFRFATLYLSISMEYDHDGYLQVTEITAKSMRRNEMVPVSDKFLNEFQNTEWDYLYQECMAYSNYKAEMYRDERRYCSHKFYESAPGIPDTLDEKYGRA
jgi:hypothetical protein